MLYGLGDLVFHVDTGLAAEVTGLLDDSYTIKYEDSGIEENVDDIDLRKYSSVEYMNWLDQELLIKLGR